MTTAHLDFTVRIAAPGADLADVAALRAQAYGHHLPGLAQAMAAPDDSDTAPGSTVLLCRCKRSGRAIGSARIQRNHPQPLLIERSLALPEPIASATRAEITRLAVRPGADPLLRPMLVGKGAGMPDYVVMITTLGGLSVFGINGVVIGPTIAAMFIAVWHLSITAPPRAP
mgnify:CR=1 FL=1